MSKGNFWLGHPMREKNICPLKDLRGCGVRAQGTCPLKSRFFFIGSFPQSQLVNKFRNFVYFNGQFTSWLSAKILQNTSRLAHSIFLLALDKNNIFVYLYLQLKQNRKEKSKKCVKGQVIQNQLREGCIKGRGDNFSQFVLL